MKRNDIKFLRFLAIISVMCSFIWPEIFPNAHIGGSLYFVISGYLLCVTFEEQSSIIFTNFILTFYFKRIRRGLPIYLITLIFILIFLYITIWREDITAIIQVLNASAFLTTILTEHKNEKMLNAFYHCWAVITHLIFSLIFPIFNHFFTKYSFLKKNATNILLILICLNLTFLSMINIDSFFGRLWQFFVGIIAFQNSVPKNFSYFFIFFSSIVTLSIIPFIPDQTSFPLDIVFVALGGIILAFKDEHFFNENPFFITKTIYHIGDISLIIYLISWPLTNLCKYIFMIPTLSFSMGIGILLASIIISIFLHHFAEDPLFKFCNSPKRLIIISAILYGILITLLLTFTSSFFVALKY